MPFHENHIPHYPRAQKLPPFVGLWQGEKLRAHIRCYIEFGQQISTDDERGERIYAIPLSRKPFEDNDVVCCIDNKPWGTNDDPKECERRIEATQKALSAKDFLVVVKNVDNTLDLYNISCAPMVGDVVESPGGRRMRIIKITFVRVFGDWDCTKIEAICKLTPA